MVLNWQTIKSGTSRYGRSNKVAEMIRVSDLADWIGRVLGYGNCDLDGKNFCLLKKQIHKKQLPTVQAIELEKIREVCDGLKRTTGMYPMEEEVYNSALSDLLKAIGEKQ